MAGKFELKEAKDGQFYFNLKAANGQIILTSEMYKSKSSATNGIESVIKNAALDERFDRCESKKGEPYFVLLAANKQIIGQSEMYSSVAAMENGINSVKTNAPGVSFDNSQNELWPFYYENTIPYLKWFGLVLSIPFYIYFSTVSPFLKMGSEMNRGG
jgi:uncharacterized protein YegP (UPF0339 family)